MIARLPCGTRKVLLPLLPSGPDGVCKFSLRRTQLSMIYAAVAKNLAERVGFEPTVPFLTGHAISSRAPSASRASLQNNRVQLSVYSLHIRIEKPPRFSASPFQAADCQLAAVHLEKRREWDSNPRTQFLELPLFESGAFNHSAISPLRARCMIHDAGYRKRTNPALQCPDFT